MNKKELEELLEELDAALVTAFPGPEAISMLVVGGACLVFADITTRQTKDVDVIIFDLLGTGEASLVYNLNPMTTKFRKMIGAIGKRHGLRGDDRMFLNDDCASFLIELGKGNIPEIQLFRAYQKLHLYIPEDIRYILACKLMAGRPDKDFEDIALLRQQLDIHTREQARNLVRTFFPDPYHQHLYDLPQTLKVIFPEG
jgi:uncharacterized nucleotidyltransferase DUF6036